MAVQAQYPSNVLFLNRGIQEGKNQIGNDYSMQQQRGAGGGFLDQPHLMFNNINSPSGNNQNHNNPRKRGREINTTPMNSILSSSIQPQHIQGSQFIDLSQLHTVPVIVSTGLRLALGDQQQQQLQTHQKQYLSPQFSPVLSLSKDFANQIEHQRDEIDQFLQAQADQLRRTLAEKSRRHCTALLGAAEESVAKRLREKEAEVEKATRKNEELQTRAAHFSTEVQVWQARAMAQEATAAALQTQLQQAIMSRGCGQKPDREKTCLSGEVDAEDAESAYIDPERVEVSSGPSCKGCGKRVASVVLLPCRHLSVCTECDGILQTCPLCLSFKNSSIEVFLG